MRHIGSGARYELELYEQGASGVRGFHTASVVHDRSDGERLRPLNAP
jgi:hypothetical protein